MPVVKIFFNKMISKKGMMCFFLISAFHTLIP